MELQVNIVKGFEGREGGPMLMTLFMFHVNNILSTAPSSTSSYTHTCIKASSAPSGSSTFPARESLEAECGKSKMKISKRNSMTQTPLNIALKLYGLI